MSSRLLVVLVTFFLTRCLLTPSAELVAAPGVPSSAAPTAPEALIFSDGFESGKLDAWSAVVPSLCENDMVDPDETDVDCGGPACPACPVGYNCMVATDCQSLVCQAYVCASSSCFDLVQNGDETGIDCGGSCPPCSSCPDSLLNGLETDVDCGGPDCPACPVGSNCLVGSDCQSLVCQAYVCASPSCFDLVQNGDETGIDCGGSCPPCSSCPDSLLNGLETDVDCGGPDCPACPVGSNCMVGSDCQSNLCIAGYCVAAP